MLLVDVASPYLISTFKLPLLESWHPSFLVILTMAAFLMLCKEVTVYTPFNSLLNDISSISFLFSDEIKKSTIARFHR